MVMRKRSLLLLTVVMAASLGVRHSLKLFVELTELCHPKRSAGGIFPRCETSTSKGSDSNHASEVSSRYLSEDQQENHQASKTQLIIDVVGTTVCVIVGAIASGLTVGMLSLDPLVLHVKERAGNEENERRQAAQLLPLIKQHHSLLVTLLLANTIASEALPIFLDGFVPEVLAVLISVILVLVFGEIVPSALFTGPKQLAIASRCAPVVETAMFLLWPVVWPISKLLDVVVSRREPQTYNRNELAALVRIHYEERLEEKRRLAQHHQDSIQSLEIDLIDDDSPTRIQNRLRHHRRLSSIHLDKVAMVEGALQMKTKRAVDVFVSYHKVFSIPDNMELDEANTFKIYSSGYSRIPVYQGDDPKLICGILMTRQLILVKKSCRTMDLPLQIPICVGPQKNLVDLVNDFQACQKHMALVCARPQIGNQALQSQKALPAEAGWMGIITLEDCLEMLLQEQIYDEMDPQMGRLRTPDEIYAEDDSYHLG